MRAIQYGCKPRYAYVAFASVYAAFAVFLAL